MILDPNIPIEAARRTIVYKIRRYINDAGSGKAVVGLSGGIDSALVLALAVEALGKEAVHGILMPSGFSTGSSVTDAEELACNLGVEHETVGIAGIYDKYMEDLALYFNDGVWSTAQENLQARIRANILMAYSNRTGAFLLNTSNKSELSVGYGTIYGDLCGAFMVIGDLYKLQVYEMARLINYEGRAIPESIIAKAPSAELRPGQKDSDTVPDYPVLDPILHALNDEDKSSDELLKAGTDPTVLATVERLMKRSAFKALQVPPVLKVTETPLLAEEKCI